MEFFNSLFGALKEHPLAAVCAVLLVAIGLGIREWLKQLREHAEAVSALQEARLDDLQRMNAEHLATATQVIPLAQQIVKAVDSLERITQSMMSRIGGGA